MSKRSFWPRTRLFYDTLCTYSIIVGFLFRVCFSAWVFLYMHVLPMCWCTEIDIIISACLRSACKSYRRRDCIRWIRSFISANRTWVTVYAIITTTKVTTVGRRQTADMRRKTLNCVGDNDDVDIDKGTSCIVCRSPQTDGAWRSTIIDNITRLRRSNPAHGLRPSPTHVDNWTEKKRHRPRVRLRLRSVQ